MLGLTILFKYFPANQAERAYREGEFIVVLWSVQIVAEAAIVTSSRTYRMDNLSSKYWYVGISLRFDTMRYKFECLI